MKNTTKSKKPRRIEINDDVRKILEKRRDYPQTKLLFNINMNTIKFFSRTCRLGGIKEIHFHSLRHTCLTNLANGYGMERALPLPKVQQIAGHSDIQTTMRYVHNDIIKETASLQWSREEKRAKEVKDELKPDSGRSPDLRYARGDDEGRMPRSGQSDEEVSRKAEGDSNLIDFAAVRKKEGLRLVNSAKN